MLEIARANDKVGLSALNAMRRPESWQRARKTKVHFPPDFAQASLRDLVQKYGWDLNSSGPGQEAGIIIVGRRDASVLKLLEDVCTNDSSIQFVLEDKEIRLLPREDALRFWTEWWKERLEKK